MRGGPEVADVFRRCGAVYRDVHAGHLSLDQSSSGGFCCTFFRTASIASVITATSPMAIVPQNSCSAGDYSQPLLPRTLEWVGITGYATSS